MALGLIALAVWAVEGDADPCVGVHGLVAPVVVDGAVVRAVGGVLAVVVQILRSEGWFLCGETWECLS